MLQTSLGLVFSDGTTKVKLSILVILYCGESVKNSSRLVHTELRQRQRKL